MVVHPLFLVLPLLLLFRPNLSSAATMVELIACDYDGLTLHIIRDPDTHQGIPYIAGHASDPNCPKLFPGPLSNEWYMSWSLPEMGMGRCGRLDGFNFTTQITIGHCDCDLVTDKDYTAVIGCRMMKSSSVKRAGSIPGVPPDAHEVTLGTNAKVIPDAEDYRFDDTTPLPEVSAMIRNDEGYQVQQGDLLEIGQDLDVLLQITVDHNYWGHLSIVDMHIQPQANANAKISFIKGMCLGAGEIDAMPPGHYISPAYNLKICAVCKDAVDNLGVMYDSKVIHGKSLAVPFKMTKFPDYPGGIEVHLKVNVCSMLAPDKCARSDCPALPNKRSAFSYTDLFRHRKVHKRTPAHPQLARYNVRFLLKVDSKNSSLPPSYIVYRPPISEDSEQQEFTPFFNITDTKVHKERSFILEICLIVAGAVLVFAFIVPCCIYMLCKQCKDRGSSRGSSEDQSRIIEADSLDTDDSMSSLSSSPPLLTKVHGRRVLTHSSPKPEISHITKQFNRHVFVGNPSEHDRRGARREQQQQQQQRQQHTRRTGGYDVKCAHSDKRSRYDVGAHYERYLSGPWEDGFVDDDRVHYGKERAHYAKSNGAHYETGTSAWGEEVANHSKHVKFVSAVNNMDKCHAAVIHNTTTTKTLEPEDLVETASEIHSKAAVQQSPVYNLFERPDLSHIVLCTDAATSPTMPDLPNHESISVQVPSPRPAPRCTCPKHKRPQRDQTEVKTPLRMTFSGLDGNPPEYSERNSEV